MSTNSTSLPSIIISPTGQQFSSQKHNNLGDDYLRFITSQTGKYLASISVKRQLTLFDLNDQTQFLGWSEENVSYVAFSEKQDQFVAVSRAPSLKMFQIKTLSDDTNTKTIILLKEIKPQLSTTTYGWAIWSLDNRWVIYVKNQDLYALNTTNFEEYLLSSDNQIKSKCTPNLLLIDRATKQLISCSKNGQICTFTLNLPPKQQNLQTSKPSIKLLKSIKLSLNPITIGDINQGRQFLVASSTSITQNKQTFYSTFVISKTNLNLIYRTKLQQQLISPPLLVQADNIQDYVVTFLKGEKSLYVFSVHDIMSSAVKQEAINDGSIQLIYPKQKISMPYLIHSINYNEASRKLLLGITGINNQDKIIQLRFMFNCSEIITNPQQSSQVKQLCTNQCQSINNYNSASYFSFLQGKCTNKSVQISNSQQSCMKKGKSYQWSQLGQACELICDRIENSVGGLSYGTQSECLCEQNYLWSQINASCKSIYSKQQASTVSNSTVSNSTIPIVPLAPIIPSVPIVPSIPTIPNSSTPTAPATPSQPNESTNTSTKNSSTLNILSPTSPPIPPTSPSSPTIITPQAPTNNNNNNPFPINNNSNSYNSIAIALSIVSVFLVIAIAVFICNYFL